MSLEDHVRDLLSYCKVREAEAKLQVDNPEAAKLNAAKSEVWNRVGFLLQGALSGEYA